MSTTRLLSWRERFRGTIELQPPEPTLVVGSWNGMTFADWQASDQHIVAAQRLFKESYFRDILAVLSNERPIPRSIPLDHAFEHGRRVGFDQMFGLLLRLPHFPPRLPSDIPSDYTAPLPFDDVANESDIQ